MVPPPRCERGLERNDVSRCCRRLAMESVCTSRSGTAKVSSCEPAPSLLLTIESRGYRSVALWPGATSRSAPKPGWSVWTQADEGGCDVSTAVMLGWDELSASSPPVGALAHEMTNAATTTEATRAVRTRHLVVLP